jgi:hypothetical protein
MAIKFNVIVEVNVDKDVVDEYDKIDSDYGETISAIIQDSFKRNIYTTRTKVYRHNMFERLNENAEDYLIRDAKEEIENEILTQHCIGGNCED